MSVLSNGLDTERGWRRLELLMHCPRRFGLREVLGLIPAVLEWPLALGTGVRVGLSAYYAGEDPDAVLDEAAPRWAAAVPKAREILHGYLEYYTGENLDVLAVEQEYEVTLGGLLFTRRMALVLRGRRDGRLYVMAHKTAGNPRARQKKLDFDGAIFTQEIVGRAVLPALYGGDWGGVIVNLLGTGKPEFTRRTMAYPPAFLDGVTRELHEWLMLAEGYTTGGESPWNFRRSWDCQRAERRCEYYPLCYYGREEIQNYIFENVGNSGGGR